MTKPAYWNNLQDHEREELDRLEKQIHEKARALGELRDMKRRLVVRAGSRKHRRKA